MADFNPYQAPTAQVDDVYENETHELAGRGTRLAAIIVDTLIYFVPLLLLMVPLVFLSSQRTGDFSAGAMAAIGLGTVGVLALFIVNLVMLNNSGQTIGKRLLNVRIVRTDGSRAGLGRIFWLRMVVPGMCGALPFVGYVFSLVDPLMIFQESRRCLHDLIADTIVVVA